MSWYREKYLRSEDWRNLRAAIIATKGKKGICFLCGEQKPLDVHHYLYRKIYDVTSDDLTPMCRTCHERLHKLLKLFPEIKKWCPKLQRKFIKAKIQTASHMNEFHWKRSVSKATRGNKPMPEWLLKFKAKRDKARAECVEFVRILDEIKDVDFLKKLLT